MSASLEIRPTYAPSKDSGGSSSEKKGKGKILKEETEIAQVFLRVDEGSEVKLPKRTLERLHALGRKLAVEYQAQQDLGTVVSKLKEKIEAIAQKYPGLRGIISEKEAFQVTATSSVTKTLNRDVIKDSLEEATYKAIALEQYSATVNIPTGLVEPEALSKVLREALLKIIPQDALPTIFDEETTVEIDPNEIDRLISEGILPPEAVTEKVTWTITPKLLK